MAGKPKHLITPRGLARFLCLDKEEVINGRHTGKKSASIVLSDENLKAMADVVEEYRDENMTPAQIKRFRSPFGSKDGQTWLKAKTKAFNEDGSDRKVPIFDAKGNPVKGNIRIGNGSVIRLNVAMAPYDMTSSTEKMAGITFYLNSVQVIRLVKFQSGFDDETAGEDDAFDASTTEFDAQPDGDEDVGAEASGPTKKDDLDDDVPF